MKFICSIESFTKLLGIAENIISAKNTISILSNVLIEAKDSKIKISACDTAINFFGEIAAEVEEEGAVSVFSNKLYSISKKMPFDEISIESDSDFNVIIKPNGKEKIIYKLKGIDPSKFPDIKSMDDVKFVSIKQEIFTDMVNKTRFAISLNDGRRFANGILFENKNKNFKMVSTDGKRLAKVEKEIDLLENDFNNIIVPQKILNETIKLCNNNGELNLSIYDKKIIINIDNYFFISDLLEANFPPYDSVIPQEQKNILKVQKKELKDSIERISLMGDRESHKIILFIEENKMKIYTENMTIGTGEENIDIIYNGENQKIALNYNFVLDVLNVIKSENVILKFNNAQSTITIFEENNNDYIYIMMPMSL